MPRKRRLDPFVSSFIDRHGKERFRFRRDGASRYLPPPGTKEYRAAYDEALTGVPKLSRAKPGTVNDLASRFYQSIPFRQMGPSWQGTMRQVIESFREEAGNHMVAHFETKHINAAVARRLEQKTEKGRKIGGTHAAKRFREVLLRLFEFAVGEGMVAQNPVKHSHKVKHKVKGYRTWTEIDIDAYRERWPLGTKARLALELMLWTGMRRGNAHKVPPPINGRFKAVAVKTGKEIDLIVTPQLKAAIDAMPEGEIGESALIVTAWGKPYTVAGFGNKMREWCDAAGLPDCSAHGLRKALAKRGAGLGLSQQELKALGQWEGDDEVRIYVADANRTSLADRSVTAISEAELEGNIG